jgi:DHA1 family multidrug resistance protein-like MFS transporter
MVLRAFFGMSVTMGLVSIAQTPMQILIIRLIHGSLGGAMSASIALASIMTKEKKMASTISFLHAMIMAGTIGGPLIGGVLADAFGFRLCFLITSCILIVCGILIAVFVEEDKTMLNTGKQFSIRENFSFFFHKKGLVTIAVIMMLAQAGRMGLIPILPLFIETIYQKKELLSTITGSVFGAAGLAAAISAAYWGKRADKKGFRSTLVLATAISTGIFAVFPFSTALWQIYALRTLLGLFASGVVPILQSMVALHTPPERRGSMLGTVSVAHWTGNALGPITTGITAQFLGFEMSFAFLGVLTATSLVLILMGVKDN